MPQFDSFVPDNPSPKFFDSQGNDVSIDPHAPNAAEIALSQASTGPSDSFSSFVPDTPTAKTFDSFVPDDAAKYDSFQPDEEGYFSSVGRKQFEGAQRLGSAIMDQPETGTVIKAALGAAGGVAQGMGQAAYIANAYLNPVERLRQLASGNVKGALGVADPAAVLQKSQKFTEWLNVDDPAYKAGQEALGIPFVPISEAIERAPKELQALLTMVTLVGGFALPVKAKLPPEIAAMVKDIKAQLAKGDTSWTESLVAKMSNAVDDVLSGQETIGSSKQLPSFTGKLIDDPVGPKDIKWSPKPEKYGASIGTTAEGTRKQLLTDPNGDYFWGDNSPTGEHAGWEVASFDRNREAKQAASETPQTRTKPTELPPVIEPPVAEGMTRLYRGRQDSSIPNRGEWFTSDKSTAAQYGDVHYVDVPPAIATAAEHVTGTAGVRIPPEWAGKAKFLEKSEPIPTYEVNGETQRPPIIATDPLVKEFLRLSDITKKAEKISDPKDWTIAQQDAWKRGDTALFSRLRGYSKSEIADYQAYQRLAHQMIEKYGLDETQSMEASRQFRLEDLSAKGELLERNTASQMYQVAALLKNATTPSEFVTRLRAMMPDKLVAWQKFVSDNAEKMWRNGDDIIAAYGKDTSVLTKSQKAWARNELTVADVMDRVAEDLGGPDKKIPWDQDIDPAGTLWMTPTQLNIVKGTKTVGGMIMKLAQDAGAKFNSLGSVLKATAESHFVEYAKLTGKQQRIFMDNAAYWDHVAKGRKELIEKGLQWPTREMLLEKGMPETSIKAYENVTHGLDYLWDLMNQMRAKNGQEAIAQIPGYMPHIHAGDFKVSVLRTRTKPDGSREQDVVHVQGYPTKWQAIIAAKAIGKRPSIMDAGDTITFGPKMEKGKPYKVMEIDELSERASQSIQEQLKAYEAQKGDPAVMALIEDIEAKRYEGFTKHNLEREDVSGYLGEHGTEANNLLWNGKNLKITQLYDGYIKSVTTAYKNSMFMAEVARPMMDHMPLEKQHGNYYGAMLDNTRYLNKYLDDYISNWTGNPTNKLKWIDDGLRYGLTEAGLSPALLREGIAKVTNLLSLSFLRMNPIYLGSNAVQFMHTMSILETISATRRLNGEANVPSSFDAVTSLLKNLPEAGPEREAASQWAEHNHVTNQPMEYEMRKQGEGSFKDVRTALQTIFHTGTLGDAAPKIENFSRDLSFRLAFEYARQMHPGDHVRARTTAQQVMDMTMVNYDRSAKPLLFTNLGAAGGVLNPLATLHNAYMGNLLIQFQMAAKSPARLALAIPAITALTTYGFFAGVNGMPFVQDINAMLDTANDLFDTHIPPIEYMMMEAGVPDWVTWGPMAAATKSLPGGEGVHIGPSLAAPTFAQPVAMAAFVKSIADIGVTYAKGVGHQVAPSVFKNPVDATEMHEVGAAFLPGSLKPFWDRHFRPEGSMMEASNKSLKGRLEATEASDMTQTVLGRRSLAHMKEGVIDQFVSNEMKREDKRLKKAVETVVDLMDKKPTQETHEWALRQASEQQIPTDKFNEMVAQVLEDRMTSNVQREVRNPTPVNERRQALRMKLGWDKIRD